MSSVVYIHLFVGLRWNCFLKCFALFSEFVWRIHTSQQCCQFPLFLPYTDDHVPRVACLLVCVWVCLTVWVDGWGQVSERWMCLCMHICMCVYVCAFVFVDVDVWFQVSKYSCCVCVCVHVCVCVCSCIHVCKMGDLQNRNSKIWCCLQSFSWLFKMQMSWILDSILTTHYKNMCINDIRKKER